MKIKPLYRAALAAPTALVSEPQKASLRSAAAFDGGGVEVDVENSLIRNAAVMTTGPALGHGFEIDATTIKQVADLINAKPNGVPVRFRHPEPAGDDGVMDDTLGTDVGYVRNARVEGNSVRGDVYLADYAEVLPGLGNAKEYLLRKAKSDPAGFGLSAVIGFDLEERKDGAGNVTGMLARVSVVDAVDFVGKPAANPNGLLSQRNQNTGGRAALCGGYPIYSEISMNELFKRILMELGLPYDCSDEAAQAFYAALTDDMKTEIQARIAAVTAATTVDLDKAAKDAAMKVGPMSAKAIAGAARAALNVKNTQAASKGAATKGNPNMDPKTKQCLAAHFGLPADATDEAAQQFYDALSADRQAEVKAKVAQLAAKAPDAASVAQLAAQTHAAMLAAEGTRVTMLNQLGQALQLDMNDAEDKAAVALAVASGDDVPAARLRYLKRLQDKCKPVQGLNIRVGDDRNLASLRVALPQAMLAKMGYQKLYAFGPDGRVRRDGDGKAVTEKFDDRAHELAPLRMRDLFRKYLGAMGIQEDEIVRLNDDQLSKAFTYAGLRKAFPRVAMLAEGVDDFDSILANVQNKGLRMAYVEMSSTWQLWCSRRTVSDFKLITDTQLSDVPDLTAKDEHGRYRRVQVSDSKETWRLGEYGHIVAFTRRALLNDDLNAFNAIPQKEAAAARRLEETLAYQVLTNNATMADTVALFHATHANLDSATANVGAPSVTTLGLARKAMRLQTAPKGSILNLIPKFLIVPAALENVAEQYTSANYVAAVQSNINPFASTGRTPLIPIVQPRLDATSATQWYTAADPNQIDTVKLAFLESEPEPVLAQNEDFHSDDVEYKVRHAVAAAALDHRGLYKNNGA